MAGEQSDTTWRPGRGGRMARPRRRARQAAPPTVLADRLDDASAYTAKFDVSTDWADQRSTITEKLQIASWVVRYWQAGPPFRRRMVSSVAVLVAASTAAILVAIALG